MVYINFSPENELFLTNSQYDDVILTRVTTAKTEGKNKEFKEKVITFKTEFRHEGGHPKKEENVYVVYEQLFYEQTRSI